MTIEPFIDRLGDRPEIIEKRRRVPVQGREDEAAIAVDARYLRDIELRVFEVARVTIGPGHRAQLAGVEIAPAMIGTGEDARRTAFLAAQSGAAMGASIEQYAKLSV